MSLHRLDTAEAINQDARHAASDRRDDTGSGRWHAGRWQDDDDYEPDEGWFDRHVAACEREQR